VGHTQYCLSFFLFFLEFFLVGGQKSSADLVSSSSSPVFQLFHRFSFFLKPLIPQRAEVPPTHFLFPDAASPRFFFSLRRSSPFITSLSLCLGGESFPHVQLPFRPLPDFSILSSRDDKDFSGPQWHQGFPSAAIALGENFFFFWEVGKGLVLFLCFRFPPSPNSHPILNKNPQESTNYPLIQLPPFPAS